MPLGNGTFEGDSGLQFIFICVTSPINQIESTCMQNFDQKNLKNQEVVHIFGQQNSWFLSIYMNKKPSRMQKNTVTVVILGWYNNS